MNHTDMEHTSHAEHHAVPYRVYGIILAILLLFTAISVGAAAFDFGNFTIGVALVLASIKSLLVLFYFMHLKFDDIMLRIMVIAVFIVLALVIVITLLDYNYR